MRDRKEPRSRRQGAVLAQTGARVRRGLHSVVLGLTLCLAAGPAGASALNFVEVQSDGGPGKVTGLAGVAGVALSPDGASLYAAGSADNAIAVFERSATSGKLAFIQSITQGDQPASGGTAVTGLETPVRVAVDPAGQAVYSISAYGALAVFDRDLNSGLLTFREALTSISLTQARAIAISPDGNDLYVAGDATGANGTGALVHITAGSATVPPAVSGSPLQEGGNITGLAKVTGMAMSADGRYLYVSSSADNAIAVFARDSMGQLSFHQAYSDNSGGISGLGSPQQLALSADGHYLYVAAAAASAVVVFARDAATGDLTYVQTLAQGDQDIFGNTVTGLGGAYALAVSPDGSQVYAAGETGNTLAALNRDTLSGRLSFADALTNNQNGVDGLAGVLDLAVTHDGQNVYTAASVQGKVGVFAAPAADLGLVMKADSQTANTGKQLQYSLLVTNKGSDAATDVALYDHLPSALSFVHAGASQGSCSQNAGAVVCRLNSLAPGTTATVTMTVSVTGTDTFTNTARAAARERDTNPGDNTDSVTLTVNHPPSANPDSANAEQGQPATIDVLGNDTDPDGDTLTLAGHDAQSAHGGAITTDAGGSNVIYTSAASFYGQDSFHYIVSDGRGATATGTVTVLVNAPPNAVDDSATAEPGSTVNIDVVHNDSDPDGDTLTISGFDPASAKGGTIARNGAGTLAYTAPSGFSGMDTFHYTIADGQGASAMATVTVVVNAPPVAVNIQAVTTPNTPVTIPILANDHDPDGNTITITALGSPSMDGASVTDNHDGTVTYSPPKDATGTDTFTYTITDGLGAQATASVSVLINSPPVALDDSAGTTTDTPVTIYVLANDHDPDGNPLHITAVENPTKAGGQAALNSDGTVTYTPPKGFTGSDRFGYTIADSHGASDSATVSVNVLAAAPGAPSGGSGVSASGGGTGGGGTAGNGGGGALDWMSVLTMVLVWSYRSRWRSAT